MVGTSARTMRRAIAQGTVRTSPRGITPAEEGYLLRTWGLLAALRRALRSETGVAAAILFGSTARGEDVAGSDIDLAVRFHRERSGAAARLADRLGRRLGRTVDVTDLAQVETDSAVLLAEILADGRPLVDRTGEWRALVARTAEIEARALAEDRASAARANAALAEFLAGHPA